MGDYISLIKSQCIELKPFFTFPLQKRHSSQIKSAVSTVA